MNSRDPTYNPYQILYPVLPLPVTSSLPSEILIEIGRSLYESGDDVTLYNFSLASSWLATKFQEERAQAVRCWEEMYEIIKNLKEELESSVLTNRNRIESDYDRYDRYDQLWIDGQWEICKQYEVEGDFHGSHSIKVGYIRNRREERG